MASLTTPIKEPRLIKHLETNFNPQLCMISSTKLSDEVSKHRSSSDKNIEHMTPSASSSKENIVSGFTVEEKKKYVDDTFSYFDRVNKRNQEISQMPENFKLNKRKLIELMPNLPRQQQKQLIHLFKRINEQRAEQQAAMLFQELCDKDLKEKRAEQQMIIHRLSQKLQELYKIGMEM